ncbi:metal ABC transporter solute-binding protein, Zn/Mn family [Alkalihalobacterium alkalinitrilicum]|uniref:metal ABC transporter solute-binding protein, Zn/Mn family n=1 Tax=Alkalihalobacterium alkalinitrilicum TaxID=427920 RepID=UPI000994B755|nr:zinc ABC transporter substrate-binding protein [Alkalihalobacterium alkalinitrilicum]
MKKLKVSLFAGMLATSSFLAACGGQEESEENVQEEVIEEVESLEVFTTLFPLENFTNKIGGEFVNVTNLIPVGADAHTYEPTAREMINVAESDLFIYNGAGMEGFADAVIETVANEDVLVLKATEGIELIGYDHDHAHDHDHEHEEHGHDHEHEEHGHDHEHEEHGHDHEHEEHGHDHEHEEHGHDHEQEEHGHDHEQEENGHHDHHHGDEDPHVWLDPILSIQLAENIKNTLVQLLPEQQEVFEANFNDVKTELEAIDAEFSAMVEEVEKDTFIVSHAGFGYWENRYGIKQMGISGLSPTNEPTRKQLEQIIEYAEKHNIKHVAFEQNFTSQVAEVVKDEVGAEPVYIHNLEVLVQENVDNEEDYFSLMRKNIEALRTALQ